MNEVNRPRKPLLVFYIAVLLILFMWNSMIAPMVAEQEIKEVDYGTFMTMTEKQQVGKVQIESNKILFTNKDGSKTYKTGVMNDPDLVNRLHASGAEFTSEIVEEMSPAASFFLNWILPIIIFVVLGQYLSRRMMDKAGGGPGSMMFNLGKSNAKVYVKSSDGIKFSDVEGVDEAEENLQEIVDYLHNPEKYREIGASMPKGVLLVGPPGTGKTMLAKAVAGEADVPFFSMSGSEFVEMFVGMGASKVRDLFRQAKEKAPCIVFIDEIQGRTRLTNISASLWKCS
jgi:cell division protease FtsH